MAYKVSNKQQPDGSRLLGYGKGKKKLSAIMRNEPGGWIVVGTEIGPCSTMRECKALWSEQAIAAYNGGEDAAKVSSQPDGPPPSPQPPIRQTFKQSDPPPRRRRPKPSMEKACVSDPFNGAQRYTSDYTDLELRQQITPLGVLIEIEAWVKRYEPEISKISEKMIASGKIRWNPFRDLMGSVTNCIDRETKRTEEVSNEINEPVQEKIEGPGVAAENRGSTAGPPPRRARIRLNASSPHATADRGEGDDAGPDFGPLPWDKK